MPISIPNPYTGQDDQTCSVSFAAQQKVAAGVSGPQTEAEYNASKQLGEWGVIKAKVAKGQIPSGTKVLTYVNENAKSRGYIYVSGNGLKGKKYIGGVAKDFTVIDSTGDNMIKNQLYQTALPQAVKPNASPTPSPAVNPGSPSEGSMSDEDVATLFVQVKDKLATEKGINIKGANPALDAEVYDAIGKQTGYTDVEVKAKIDNYKASGKKLSALKKKTLKGASKTPDPKPHDVPTKATTTTAEKAKEEVKKVVEDKPKKLYSDEDIAAQYIIIKDAVVAASNGKWTLYTKSEEMDSKIYLAIEMTTGYDTLAAKTAIANYLASGKKLSQLKKSLAKQGAFTPKADTLKKTGPAKTEADKTADIAAKADEGYTPTPTPATGVPPVDTGKPAPKRVVREAAESGDISGISDVQKINAFGLFKGKGNKAWLSTGPAANYDAFAAVQIELKAQGKDYTLLQIMRISDEQGAKKAGVENGHLFEKAVVEWLTTPAGKQHVLDQRAAQLKAAEKAKAKAEIEKNLQKLQDSQPPLPADSALFSELTVDQAFSMQSRMFGGNPWTERQKRDLKHYTGGSYSAMNGYMRGLQQNISDRDKNAIEGAQAGMRPSVENIIVHRGTGVEQLGLEKGEEHLIWGLVGKVFEDKGFLSTSVGGRAAFSNAVTLEIECPIGTKMAFVKGISNYPGENEMLLAGGLKYKLLRVSRDAFTGKYLVRMRVVQ